MGKPTRIGLVAGLAAAIVLVSAQAALATSAEDQYSEGIPSAGGQKPARDAAERPGTATIASATEAQLQKTKKGRAVVKAAAITAPGAGGSSDSGDGLGWWLLVILAASLLAAGGIYLGRRR
jgi:hypothetical protein